MCISSSLKKGRQKQNTSGNKADHSYNTPEIKKERKQTVGTSGNKANQ